MKVLLACLAVVARLSALGINRAAVLPELGKALAAGLAVGVSYSGLAAAFAALAADSAALTTNHVAAAILAGLLVRLASAAGKLAKPPSAAVGKPTPGTSGYFSPAFEKLAP